MTKMTTIPEGYVKKETTWFVALVALAMGFLGGIVFSVYKTGSPPAVPQQQGQVQSQAAPPAQNTSAILALEKEVLTNPDNREAWVHLGNYYFDNHKFDKAINAYTKALELNPNDVNVLTDLGVMYRRSGDPRKAIASFDKAIALAGDHPTPRFNKGIVLLNDLNDVEGALQAWEELVKQHPDATAPNGKLVTEVIAEIRKQQAEQAQPGSSK